MIFTIQEFKRVEHSSTLPAHLLVVSWVAFLEACSPSVHLVSNGARSLQKTNKNCVKSLCWDRLQKYHVVMDQNASTPPQRRYKTEVLKPEEQSTGPEHRKALNISWVYTEAGQRNFRSFLRVRKHLSGGARGLRLRIGEKPDQEGRHRLRPVLSDSLLEDGACWALAGSLRARPQVSAASGSSQVGPRARGCALEATRSLSAGSRRRQSACSLRLALCRALLWQVEVRPGHLGTSTDPPPRAGHDSPHSAGCESKQGGRQGKPRREAGPDPQEPSATAESSGPWRG